MYRIERAFDVGEDYVPISFHATRIEARDRLAEIAREYRSLRRLLVKECLHYSAHSLSVDFRRGADFVDYRVMRRTRDGAWELA